MTSYQALHLTLLSAIWASVAPDLFTRVIASLNIFLYGGWAVFTSLKEVTAKPSVKTEVRP